MTALWLFGSTFLLVFALGLQSLNVNGGHYVAAFVTSFAIGGANLVLFKLAPDASGVEIVAYLFRRSARHRLRHARACLGAQAPQVAFPASFSGVFPMSIRLMSRVWESSFPTSQKMLLLALADCANDEGVCWPSVPVMARKCSLSERTVQRCLQELMADDLKVIKRTWRDGTSCIYQIDMAAIVAFDQRTAAAGQSSESADRHSGGDRHSGVGRNPGPNPRHHVTGDTMSQVTPCHPTGDTMSPHPRHHVTPRGDTMSPKPSFESSLNVNEPSRVPTHAPAREASAAKPELPVRQDGVHPACIPGAFDRPFVKQARQILKTCFEGKTLSPPQREWIRRAFKWTEQDLQKVEAQAREHINALALTCAVASQPAEALAL